MADDNIPLPSGRLPKTFEILRYIGPGLFVTVGFIDPGNWATNMAAGAAYGYKLLWVVTLSTVMLIVLQHNAAHLGIATGLCIAEGAGKYFKRLTASLFIGTAMLAAVATALAEVLGAAVGLQMLFKIPIAAGAVITSAFAAAMLLSNSYKRLEAWIIGFVAIIGVSFLFELAVVDIKWGEVLKGCFIPQFPTGSITVIMGVLGAVVMPHNLFLHSEVIQSRKWNLQGDEVINKQLKYEFMDTMTAMVIGWVINGAMIVVAASVFYSRGIAVTELPQAQAVLRPIAGNAAAVIFALALLAAGLASSITAAMAGGSILSGLYQKPLEITDKHTRVGIGITLLGGLFLIFMLNDPFKGLLWSQIALSVQLPWTIFGLIYLTSSKKVMGKYANSTRNKISLFLMAAIVTILNILLIIDSI
ncbi:MAG: Nramp family divalent metal transporter [Nitrospirae bacterium]|uniref:Nramp family divalent metal transporter n=1 Tax=Candidatus Magnetominusculus dajiuhuensis TaxID=3137712 RepID=UPI001A1027E2|nr:Nramp family divalent metal transporter [Nitrospirota bacterium]